MARGEGLARKRAVMKEVAGFVGLSISRVAGKWCRVSCGGWKGTWRGSGLGLRGGSDGESPRRRLLDGRSMTPLLLRGFYTEFVKTSIYFGVFVLFCDVITEAGMCFFTVDALGVGWSVLL